MLEKTLFVFEPYKYVGYFIVFFLYFYFYVSTILCKIAKYNPCLSLFYSVCPNELPPGDYDLGFNSDV